MKTNKYLLVSLLLCFIISCSKKAEVPKNNDPCNDFHSPYVLNNGPVREGESLQLFANTDEDNVSFSWSGPGNFSSTMQNPLISNIPYSGNGSYYVQMTGALCQANQVSTAVVVTPPCDLIDLQGTFNNQTWNFYSGIVCGNGGSNSTYQVHAESANGELDVNFNKLDEPTGFVKYPVDGSGIPNFDSTKVQMKLTTSSSVVYNATTGTAYIGHNGSQLFVSFCNVIFYNAASGTSWAGCKAKISCQ